MAGTPRPLRRMPHPWYRRSRGEWYATVNDRQIPLGVSDPADEAAAWAVLRQMMKDAAREAVAESSGPGLRPGAVAELVPLWLAEKAPALAPRTAAAYKVHLDWLVRGFGPEPAAAVSVAAILRAAAAVGTWGDTHRANVLATAAAFLRWCGRADRLPLPPRDSRGAESVIGEPLHRRCLREATGDFHQLLRFLWECGCRPGEATGLSAEAVAWDRGTVRIKQHKTRVKGRVRTLYLSTEALAVLAEQRERYGEGLLFRNSRGVRFSLQAMTARFERLSAKVGERVTSYMYRHTWATRALKVGLSVAQVAEMMGHASPAMVFRHYGHLCAEAEFLREQAERVGRPPEQKAG